MVQVKNEMNVWIQQLRVKKLAVVSYSIGAEIVAYARVVPQDQQRIS